MIRVLKILGKGVLVLALLGAVGLGVLRVVWGRQLAAEMEAIRARGEPLTMADFPQPKVPDSQNAALIYEQAFKELPESDKFWHTISPIGDLLKKGDLASLAKAADLLLPYEHAIVLSEKAASMPQCVFPPTGRNEVKNRPEFRLWHLSSLLGYRARLVAGHGESKEAVRLIQLQLRMGNCLGKEEGLVSFLRGVNLIYIACTTLGKSAPKVTISEAQAGVLYDAFGKVDIKQMYIQAIQSSRAYTNDGLTRDRESYRVKEHLTDPLGWIYVKVFMIKEQTALLHSYSQVIGSADLSYQEFMAKDVGYEGIPFYAILARILVPVNAESFSAYCRYRAQVAGSQIFLALLAYHDRYGSYPATLDELRAKLGWPLEKDPFTGKDFIYRRQGKGFLLYSLDKDLQDNGGRPFAKYDEPRDIVWTIPD